MAHAVETDQALRTSSISLWKLIPDSASVSNSSDFLALLMRVIGAGAPKAGNILEIQAAGEDLSELSLAISGQPVDGARNGVATTPPQLPLVAGHYEITGERNVDAGQAAAGDAVMQGNCGCYCPACQAGGDWAGGAFTSFSTSFGADPVGAHAPPGTLQNMADFVRDGFWSRFLGNGATQRYYNVTNGGVGAKSGSILYNVTWSPDDSNGISAARAELVREAFKIYQEVLGISFVESTSTKADFFFGDNVVNSAYAYSNMYSGNSGPIKNTIINVGSAWNGGSSAIGDYSFQTFIHEIGHGLGLGHQGLYNATSGSPTYDNSAQLENDSWALTMMSYWNQVTNTSASTSNYTYARLVSPMSVDWIALNDLYGGQGYGIAHAFTGNTIWGVGTNISAATSAVYAGLADFAASNAFTVIDGGGIDKIDFSIYVADQVINLRRSSAEATNASVSSVGGYTGNMTIADDTIIENAASGSGNDTLLGNLVGNYLEANAGNDLINGRLGNDTMVGGLGADKFYFNSTLDGLANRDTIIDFSAAQGDTFQLAQSIFTTLEIGPLVQSAFFVGAAAFNSSQHILYNNLTGDLLYDSDGSGGTAAITFAKLASLPSLTSNQFIVV